MDYYLGENIVFVGIDAIDAGLLEAKEDLVEVILAKLLNQINDMERNPGFGRSSTYDYQRREFDMCVQELCTSNSYRKGELLEDEFSSIEYLRKRSISINMRDNLKSLIDRYITLVRAQYSLDSRVQKDFFVVIPIDDIDMNIEKGYEMLEQIRRYLMIPNVIILLSYKYNQLADICDLYYVGKFNDLGKLYKDKSDRLAEKVKECMNN